ncbi:MAG TPA: NrfD/PsrC family molybdoenzyme membrane anchor subunit [Terriglobales bacterium]|nr:NrfD/PsrC family molybdoenzyme membrane anchor subunit [Terriglobales bacterium]
MARPTEVEIGENKAPVIVPGHTFATITDKIASIVLRRPITNGWLFGFAICFLILQWFLLAVCWLFYKGVGVWGVNIPIGWGFAIVNFVWWIGIGHAGTLISAILLLLRQAWRNSINRFAEAMTLFAVACAGMFPLLHLGRPWLFYWLFPYSNTMTYWPNFRSPLVWDVFAVSTYLTISLVFWFVGLIPDMASLRDQATNKAVRFIYGMLCMGWRNSVRHWRRYETAYLLLAGLATPLVLSVHTVVSFDFSIGIVPGWHTTIFPPYFVAGAIYSGFAMVLVLAIPIRKYYDIKDFITDRHIENSAMVMLATGWIVAYGYAIEAFVNWFGGDPYESFLRWNRLHGPYAFWYYALLASNILVPQLLWFRKLRTDPFWLFLISLDILTGMWLERFIIVVVSLTRDFLPSSFGQYYPTWNDWSVLLGTLGFFAAGMYLFLRLLPAVSISELKTLIPQSEVTVAHAEEVHDL